jgi:hypothetical protein
MERFLHYTKMTSSLGSSSLRLLRAIATLAEIPVDNPPLPRIFSFCKAIFGRLDKAQAGLSGWRISE